MSLSRSDEILDRLREAYQARQQEAAQAAATQQQQQVQAQQQLTQIQEAARGQREQETAVAQEQARTASQIAIDQAKWQREREAALTAQLLGGVGLPAPNFRRNG